MNHETTHTPGPWFLEGDGVENREGYVVVEFDGLCVDFNDATAKANARLIAAAPDLLAACKEFVRKCENGEASSRRSYAQMKDAISKAEGR